MILGGPKPPRKKRILEKEIHRRIAELSDKLRAIQILKTELANLEKKYSGDTTTALLLLKLEKVLASWETDIVTALQKAQALLRGGQ